MEWVILVINDEINQYFVAEKHSNYGLSHDWVPCSFPIPHKIVPREGLEDGIVDSLEKVKLVYANDYRETTKEQYIRELEEMAEHETMSSQHS